MRKLGRFRVRYSAGYDTKVWALPKGVGVEAALSEMGHNTQAEPFSVVGMGDMVAMSSAMACCFRRINGRAIAHLLGFHEFEASFAERKRLFALPRSLDGFDACCSKGGGEPAP